MNIMICLDGSELSRGAIAPAKKLAEAAGAKVHLVRVIDPNASHESVRGTLAPSRRATGDWSGRSLPGAGGGLRPIKERERANMIEDRGRALARAESTALDQLHAETHDLPGAPVCEVLVAHNAVDAITDYAKREAIDVICMATHSRAGLSRMLFGSTTSAVVDSGVAPVLVVKPGQQSE